MGENYDLQIDADALIAELEDLAQKKKAVGESNGELRKRISQILEQKGYHKSALAMIRQIDAMSRTSRNDFLRTFEPMFDAMLSAKWRDEQQDLFDDKTETEPPAGEAA